MALSTEWSRALGLEAPIVNAPMGGVADGALAAAVSRDGGQITRVQTYEPSMKDSAALRTSS